MGNEFQGQIFDIKNINGGEKYKEGDGIGANAINAPIESALYMQNLGTNAPDISEIGGSGTPNVEIVKDASGNPKFKFSNLKGVGVVNENLVAMRNCEWGFLQGGSTSGQVTVQTQKARYKNYPQVERTSDFIAVTAGEKYTFQIWVEMGSAGMWYAYQFYDSNKSPVGTRITKYTVDKTENGIATTKETFTVPTGAAYVRVSGRTYGNGRFKLEKGASATAYVPHPTDVTDPAQVDCQRATPHYAVIEPSGYGKRYPSIDTKNRTITFYHDTCIMSSKITGGHKSIQPEKTVSFAHLTTSFIVILYDIESGEIMAKGYSEAFDPDKVLLLFTIRCYTTPNEAKDGYKSAVSGGCPCWIGDKLYGVIGANETKPNYYGSIIPPISGALPEIDTAKKTFFIPNDTVIKDSRLPNGYVTLPDTLYTWYGESAVSSALNFYYEIETGNIVKSAYNGNNTSEDTHILIASARIQEVGYTSSPIPMLLDGKLFGLIDLDAANSKDGVSNPYINVVNHRGYNAEAPENTLSAYKLSKKKGFEYVECDVSYTSDGVAVLMHDVEINRTARNADGTAIAETVYLSSITYEQALTYDYGIWKSSKYAGEKIPTFEEFVKLCKQLGLKPYVELKHHITDERAAGLVATIKRYGILKDTTWISFDGSWLEKILAIVPNARIGYTVGAITQDAINWVKTHKTADNDIFMNAHYAELTSGYIQACITEEIPLEVWTVNGADIICGLDNYISGYSSDSVRADIALYDEYTK